MFSRITRKAIMGTAVFCGAMSFGAYVGRQSWNGAIFLTSRSFTSSLRNPAAVRRDLDFTKLDGAELITGNHNRLITSAKVLFGHNEQAGEMGLEFGHFVTRDEQGNKQLACDFYDRIRMTFEAEGMASSGERPTMTIEGPCRTADDITRIEPIWVPVVKILSEKATDMDLSFPENEGVNFKFQDMTGEWPTRWHLSSVRVYNDAENGRSLELSNHDLHQIGGKPVVLAWPSKSRLPTSARAAEVEPSSDETEAPSSEE